MTWLTPIIDSRVTARTGRGPRTRFHNRYVPIGAATARRIAVTIIGQPVGLMRNFGPLGTCLDSGLIAGSGGHPGAAPPLVRRHRVPSGCL